MRKLIASCCITLIVAVSLGLTGCAKTETSSEVTPLVRSQVVNAVSAEQTAQYSGEVRGRYEAQLAFQASGKISKRNVELGTTVNPGDVLLEIDTKDIQQTVTITSAQVASAQSQLKLAETNLERYRMLYEQGAVSKAQLDQYQNAYEVASAAVRQASAQYNQGANQLSYTSLVADTAGVIASINAEAGQVVSAGQPVVTLVKDGEREIEINVPESRMDELRKAQDVLITFWALPGVTTKGKVREISPVADKISRTYKARISILTPPAGMNLGMTASVTVVNPGQQQAVYIPLSAIYQTGSAPNVWVVRDGAVSLQPVKLGSFGEEKVQVLEGLRGGEVIVTAGVQKLREGQKVRL